MRLKNQANTNIQFCGGRLLALWEAGLPYRIDPRTLETEGVDLLEVLHGDAEGLPVEEEGLDLYPNEELKQWHQYQKRIGITGKTDLLFR